MIEQKNYGVINEIKPSDWVSGVNSKIVWKDVLGTDKWKNHLQATENQCYHTNYKFETYSCVNFTVLKIISNQCNLFLHNNLIPEYQLNLLKGWNYIINNSFNFSEPHNAVLTKTSYEEDTVKGNSATTVWDTTRKIGVIPQEMCDREAVKTVEEWYGPLTQEQIDFGKNFLKVFNINYEFVVSSVCSAPKSDFIKKQLQQSPLQMLAHCGTSQVDGIIYNEDCETQHSTELYDVDENENRLQFDQYEPYFNKLSKNYVIPYLVKGVITLKTEEETKALMEGTSTLTNKEQQISIIKKLLALYWQVIALMKKTSGFVGSVINKIKK